MGTFDAVLLYGSSALSWKLGLIANADKSIMARVKLLIRKFNKRKSGRKFSYPANGWVQKMKNVSQRSRRKESGGVKRLKSKSIWGLNKDIKTRSMAARDCRVTKAGFYRPSSQALTETRPFPKSKRANTTVPPAV